METFSLRVSHHVSSSDCWCQKLGALKNIFVLLLLLKISLVCFHISLFLLPPPQSPLSWSYSWMIESAVLYASCPSLPLCGGEKEIVLRIQRENYSFSWPWGAEKTRLPCSINCYLRETDILGGDSGFGNVTNLSKWKWQCVLQFCTVFYSRWRELMHPKVFADHISVYLSWNLLCNVNSFTHLYMFSPFKPFFSLIHFEMRLKIRQLILINPHLIFIAFSKE